VRIEDSTSSERGNGAAQPALLTVRQAAEILTVSRRKVYNLVTAGKLPHYRIDNVIRIAETDVDAYLADCRVAHQPLLTPPAADDVSPRVRKPPADQRPVKTSHLEIGPRQLALLRREGVGISAPNDRSAG